jgi:hypothetical protein
MGLEALVASIPEMFSMGAADAGAAAAGTIGADAAGTAAAGSGIADIVGTGSGLFGGTTGLEGTAMAGGFGGGIGDLAAGTAGLGALGTAADFMAAPGASALGGAGAGFGAAADAAASQAGSSGLASGPASVLGSGPGPLGAITPPPSPQAVGGVQSFGGSNTLSPNVANANAGASVFDTGTSPLTSSPGAAPAGASASSLAAPSGVTAPFGADPTAAAGATAGATPAPGASAPSPIDSLVKGATDSLTKNPLGVALGAAGLGYNILQGQKQTGNQNALSADAATATANSGKLLNQGEALTQYLTNGTLPPAYQTQVDQAINDAKTKAISNAAANGQPTDPTKNTSLAQELAQIDNQRGAMQTQVAQQLFQSGAGLINSAQGAAGLSGQLYQTLVQNDTTQSANMGKAIATLAAAMNGKSQANIGGTTVSVGGP